MLDMRWKALDRAMDLREAPAQGDAVFLAFLRLEDPMKRYKTLLRVEN